MVIDMLYIVLCFCQTNTYIQYFARHVDDKGKQVAMSETERMTQDQDKRRTYDMARLAYSQVVPSSIY